MNAPTVDIYAELYCPFAYLMTYRIRQIWPGLAGRLHIRWRSLALEYVDPVGESRPMVDALRGLLAQVEPELPMASWARPDWEWPSTAWPGLEAIACAQAQSDAAAFELSWALRRAFFAESRNLALRREIFAVAAVVAEQGWLDLATFEADWDGGRYKRTVLEDCRRGWEVLRVPGSPTIVLPDGRQIANPAFGSLDYDSERQRVRSYTPYEGDPIAAYRALLEPIAAPAPAGPSGGMTTPERHS